MSSAVILTTDTTEFTDESHWPEWIRVLREISGYELRFNFLGIG